MQRIIILSLFLFSSLFTSCKNNPSPTDSTKEPSTIVSKFGNIRVKGNSIVDKNNQSVQLRGMSMFWSQWGGAFYNADCIKWLVSDFKCTIVRAACGVESGGYLTNPQAELAKVYTVIDACIEQGIYVIVDWHDHNAEKHLVEAKAFFTEIAKKYGNRDNILYEIYNEPLQVSWSNVVKPYSLAVIQEIRKYDPDNLIIVGSPNWSQDVDVAANDAIKDTNVAYSLHFYSSTHTQSLRNKAITAINKGLPLFITEYGISEASGTGNINYTETSKWLDFIELYKLSSCNWSIIDKDETSAALKAGASAKGGWDASKLSVSGTYIRNFIRTKNESIFSGL